MVGGGALGAMTDEDGRQRDLLPLPVGRDLQALLGGAPGQPLGRSRSAARRRSQRLAENSWLEEGICALNHMGARGCPWKAGSRVYTFFRT